MANINNAQVAIEQAPELVRGPCPLCGEPEADPIWTSGDRLCGRPGNFTVARCRRCGLFRQEPRVPEDRIGFYYPEDYVVFTQVIEPRVAGGRLDGWRRDRLEVLSGTRSFSLGRRIVLRVFSLSGRARFQPLAFAGEGRRLLDIGCGVGNEAAEMAARGWRVTGIEANAGAAATARSRGIEVVEGPFPDAGERTGGAFDAVIMSQVIEHFVDPVAALRATHDLMKPGGILILRTPWRSGLCARVFGPDWYALEQPRHYVLFTPRDLGRALDAAGFDTLWTFALSSTASWTRSAVYRADRMGRPGRLARRWDRGRAFHRLAAWPIQWLDALGLGDGGAVVARRR